MSTLVSYLVAVVLNLFVSGKPQQITTQNNEQPVINETIDKKNSHNCLSLFFYSKTNTNLLYTNLIDNNTI